MYILIITAYILGSAVHTNYIEFNTQFSCDNARKAYEPFAYSLGGNIRISAICVKK